MRYTFDPLMQRYPSRRYPIYARDGMVNTSSALASSAGLRILQAGGNALDAIVAAASTLTVTEPTSNGLGSDGFAIVWSAKDRKLYGLNASGPAPMLMSPERLAADGNTENGGIPARGWTPVTVPGAVSAWMALNKRFGRLSLSQVLAPAVQYARDGYPCPANLASGWQAGYRIFDKLRGNPVFDNWFRTFASNGKAPEAGELVQLPDHANTLEEIGQTDGESFYRGRLARMIDEESRRMGGYLRYEDLAAFQPRWVEPMRVNYRGWEVCEIPPNGQGIVALMTLNILKEFELKGREDPQTVHLQLEAMKLAFARAFDCITDPDDSAVDFGALLDPKVGAEDAARITGKAQIFTRHTPKYSGTVYLCAADGEGNMVSYIQSNYMGFGSGVVVNGTGIALQNRGYDFSLDPKAANVLKPGKRTYHTIIPGFLMKDGLPVGPFGVMGGYMQPQGHVQVATNLIDFGMDPQQALDAPRWQWTKEDRIVVESSFDASVARALNRMGHKLTVELNSASFGRGQVILREDNGVLIGGTESRTDGNIACF